MNQSAFPFVEEREPFRLISMSMTAFLGMFESLARASGAADVAKPATKAMACRREYGDIVTGAASR
ncbi:hypothetical protein ABIA85_009582 [Bradyrhizobium sp. LA6.10]|uniref:hypothetical protein n=1 Tax=Bradyrhizobium sp. LA6.10 TaxID=3156318 RepID=UPI003391F6E7